MRNGGLGPVAAGGKMGVCGDPRAEQGSAGEEEGPPGVAAALSCSPSPGLFPSKGLFGQLNGLLLIYGTFRCILSAQKCFRSSFEVEEGVGVRSATPGL